MPEDSPDPKAAPAPGPTPSGYQRTTGGKLRWQPPPVERLQNLLSGYEVISLIGHGGMGAVYRARQMSLDRLVAIKVLPPEAAEDDATFVERFKNEARTMAKLNHPGIVHVHDFGETKDGQLYFVMEFVEGTDVQRMLLDHRVLTPEYALPITAHVCDALQCAHAQGVVHRDIKPANIMLTNEGQVKVADFGLAKLDDPSAGGLTQTNMSMGTPDYVAPETLTMGMTPDGRADLYAVGVMLYHMLVGEVPRGAFDLPSKRNAALDPRIDAVILRAMKQNRDERYQSAAELRADVNAILSTPQVKSGGEPSAAIPKQAVAKAQAAPQPQPSAQKPGSRSAPVNPTNRSAHVKPVKKQTMAVTPVSPGKAGVESNGEVKPRNLAWVVPTGISAFVIIGGAFFMRGQRQKEIAPEAPQAVSATAGAPAKPIKVIDDKPNPSSESKEPKLADDKWTRFDPASDFAVVKSGVTETAGAITIAGGQGRRLRTNWSHEDIAVRARIHVPKGSSGVIGLRGDFQKDGVRAVVRPGGVVIEREIFDGGAERGEVLKEFPGVSAPFFETKGAVLMFATQGEDLNVWVDGKRLGAVTEPLPIYKGKILFDGKDATFSNLEWQVLGNSRQPDRAAANEFASIKLEPGKWARVLFPDNKPPKGEIRDGALILPKREQCRLPPVFAARNAAIRAKISTTSGDGSYKGLYFKLRNDLALGFFNLSNPNTAHVGIQPDMSKDLVTLASSKDGAFPLGKKDLLVEFAVVGDDLILAIEGKTMATARISEQPTGNRAQPPFLALIQAGWNTVTLRDLEFMSLDRALPSTYPEFIKAAFAAPVANSTTTAPTPASIATSPASSAPPTSNAPKLPAELLELQSTYAAAISERVTGPHDASVKQLNAGFTAALDRAVAARQFSTDSIVADKKAVESNAALPPDLDSTPDALKTLRATYRTKMAEIDDTRTTAHLGLLTPYIAKLKQLEADLTKATRIPDAETVKAYRESLGENPFALPSAKP